MRRRYLALRKEVADAVREDKARAWARYVAKGARILATGDMGGSWKWAATTLQKGGPSKYVVPPVRDRDGNLLVEPGAIRERWGEHYRDLGADPEGLSRNIEYYTERLAQTLPPERPVIAALNEDISIDDVREALSKMAGNKAAGRSGVTPGLLKAALVRVKDEGGVEHDAPFLKLIWRLTSLMFAHSHVCEGQRLALIVTIFKKGDATECDNYRGISLMDSILKVLCVVMASRLSKVVETEHLIRPEQAGFRVGMECPGQMAALLEICRRCHMGPWWQSSRTWACAGGS
jgi:hypothetical protein